MELQILGDTAWKLPSLLQVVDGSRRERNDL
jgi:hypothetical protein